jgi:hypothetical protein
MAPRSRRSGKLGCQRAARREPEHNRAALSPRPRRGRQGGGGVQRLGAWFMQGPPSGSTMAPRLTRLVARLVGYGHDWPRCARCRAQVHGRRRCVALPAKGSDAEGLGPAVVREVLLVVDGQLAGEKLSSCPTASLATSATTLPLPPTVRRREHPTRGALLSSDDFGSSVERDGGGQVLWPMRMRVAEGPQ